MRNSSFESAKTINSFASTECAAYNCVKDYLDAIEEYKLLFLGLSEEALKEEISQINFHYGVEEYPVVKGLKPGETAVSWREDEDILEILAEEGIEGEYNTAQNTYTLWKDGHMSEDGWHNFHPWQDPDIFCKAMAALQILVKQGEYIVLS